jgi:hypothetical protein
MKIRQANKIRKAAVAYSGGYPHRHRKPTIIAAMRRIVWRGWRWPIDFSAMDRYARQARAEK